MAPIYSDKPPRCTEDDSIPTIKQMCYLGNTNQRLQLLLHTCSYLGASHPLDTYGRPARMAYRSARTIVSKALAYAGLH